MLDLLVPEFRAKVEAVLLELEGSGFTFRPFCTLRDPFDQAREWRKGATAQEIAHECGKLREQGAPRIAACIESVGPQFGRKTTNAMPGFSWHQFGEAIDCFLLVRGKADWNAEGAGYKAYAQVAKAHGLKAGRDFRDPVHIQLRQQSGPHSVWDIGRIDNLMAARWSAFAALKGA